MNESSVCRYYSKWHTHTHWEATTIAEAAAPSPIWNASFIQSTSELNFPFALNSQTLNRICAIDISTQKRQFTHEIVCFWCINNFRHARFALPARLNSDGLNAVFVVGSVVISLYVSAAKCIFASHWMRYIVDSKHYDASFYILILNGIWHRVQWFVSLRSTAWC